MQHAASGQALAFQSLADLVRFIQSWMGDPGNAGFEFTDGEWQVKGKPLSHERTSITRKGDES